MNKYLIRNIQALCLIGLIYWGLDYVINYVFIISSFCFISVANITAYFESKYNKDKSMGEKNENN